MTREEAKQLLPIIQAYVDGKTIQYSESCLSYYEWVDCNCPEFDIYKYNYRIKPEPTYRPFKDAEECWEEMKKHEPFGWVTFEGNKEYIVCVTEATIKIYTTSYYDYEEALSKFKFADGQPFGKLTEEE